MEEPRNLPDPEPSPETSALEASLRGLRLPPSIDRYRILDLLGEGGMGMVYLAEETEPPRRVALKVIKPGMDSREVLLRFERERQTLASMNHDAIAKVFAVGVTESKQPYFAMEWVQGEPIDAYCEHRQLRLDARLRLFQRVCAGVHHAHQNGVVHRDLKPGNVLVFEVDGEHRPKIIDFGIAHALERDGQKAMTIAGQLLGTPEYMAPEQALRNHASGIVLGTDVYALGVILYVLLTGELPFPGLRQMDDESLQRTMRDVEPTRPSERVMRDQSLPAARAASLDCTPRALLRMLRSDLDWIVARAMAKEPERRYASAAAFADDLQLFLDGRPVLAGPPGKGYRLKKFMRRHRLQSATAMLIGAALVVAFVAITIGLDSAQASSANAWMSTARLAQERGNWQQALASLDQADATGRVDAVEVRIGRILAHLGAFDDVQATRELRALETMHIPAQQVPRVRLLQGLFANRVRNPEAGLDQVRIALESGCLTPGEHDLAEFLLADRFETAAAAIDRALRRDPHDRLANMAKVSLLFCAGQIEEARGFGRVLQGIYPDDPLSAIPDLLHAVLADDPAAAEAALGRMRPGDDEGLAAAARQFVRLGAPLRRCDDTLVRLVFDHEPFGDDESASMSRQSALWGVSLAGFFVTAGGQAGFRAVSTLGSVLPPCWLKGVRPLPSLLFMALRPYDAPVPAREDEAFRKLIADAADTTGLALFCFMTGYMHAMRGDHEAAIRSYERAARSGSLVPVPRSIERGLLASRMVLWRKATVPGQRLLQQQAQQGLERLWRGEHRDSAVRTLLAFAVELGAESTVFAMLDHWLRSEAVDDAERQRRAAAIGPHVDALVASCRDPHMVEVLRMAVR